MANTTWTGASDNVWGFPPGNASGNFSGGTIPTTSDDVTVNGTPGTDITMPDFSSGVVQAKSYDFTGFAAGLIGNVITHASSVNSVTYAAGMTFTCKFEMSHTGTGTITTNGVQIPGFLVQTATTANVTFGDDVETNYFRFTGNDATINQGTRSLTVAPQTLYDGLHGGLFEHVSNATHWNWSAGATLIIDSGSSGSPTTVMNGPTGADGVVIAPPTSIIGSKAITYHARIKFQSLDMSGYTGTITCDLFLGKFITVGDMDLGAGTIVISDITSFVCGGDFTCAGNLDGGVSGATFIITGSATATGGASKTITNCTFTASTLHAPGCIDGGGNTNVDFTPTPSGDEQLAGIVAVVASL